LILPGALLLGVIMAGAGRANSFQNGLKDACATRLFEGAHFTICPFDAHKHDFRLAFTASDGWPLRHLPALARDIGEERNRVRFAMNAGMYDRTGKPLGLFVENGKQVRALNTDAGAGNFFLKPGGIFSLGYDNVIRIDTTEIFQRRKAKPRFATQSGPMLVIKGKLHPAITQDGASRHFRNGVGIENGDKAWFVISDDRISLGKFARFFRDDLHCRDALFLDGAVSSLWFPGGGRMDSHYALGPMLLVSNRPQ
jgi:uncharacterized protein YigE (DUF2233 family)